MYIRNNQVQVSSPRSDKSTWLFVLLILAGVVLVGRLFFIQIIRHDYYKNAALSEQYKKFSIPSERGKIYLVDGDSTIPVVLNESRYLIYADPAFISDSLDVARKLQPIIGSSVDELEKKLNTKSRYVELVKKADADVMKKVEALALKGIVSKELRVRSYPQAQLAAQVLGFVNDDGEGQYGIEGWLNDDLKGKSGLLKAVTDVNGVPLAGNSDNIKEPAVPGRDVTLTIDLTVQQIVEDALKEAVESTKAPYASAIVMNVNNGEIKAMANWPTYNPSQYSEVKDASVYKNATITNALEAGSIMKPLTIASAFDQNLVTPESTFMDNGFTEVDGIRINNAMNIGVGQRSIYEIVRYSLNTGVVHLLRLMGGGEINKQARDTWYSYLHDHYRFGQATGIEQLGETKGIVPDPDEGEGLNIQYANTCFGQGIAVSPIQMISAFASIINGGTYYKPRLIHSITDGNGSERVLSKEILRSNVVSSNASNQIVSILERNAIDGNQPVLRNGFKVGGKTGTAQIPDGNGGYRADAFIGTYSGFVSSNNTMYLILVTISEPKAYGFAGSVAARPIYYRIANGMMDSFPFDE